MLLTSSDSALLAKFLDSIRATGDATLVQLARGGRALASIEGSLSVGRHGVPGMDLMLQGVGIVLFSWVGNGRSRQAGSCNSEEFGKLDHFEQGKIV